jgi:hypothetical protein
MSLSLLIEVSMIRHDEFQKFEIEFLRNGKLDLKKKFKILEALYKEAVALGVFPLRDSLEGLDVDIRIAKVVNNVSKDT